MNLVTYISTISICIAVAIFALPITLESKRELLKKISRIGLIVAVLIFIIVTIIFLSTHNKKLDNDPINLTTESDNSEIQSNQNNLNLKNSNDEVSESSSIYTKSEEVRSIENSTTIDNKSNESQPNEDNYSSVVQPTRALLSEMKTYSYDGSYKREDITSDPRGNTYNDAYVFYGEYYTLNTGEGEYNRPFFEKYISGDFGIFSASIIPHKTFDKYNKGVGAEIKIYGDGILIYTSPLITRKTEEIDVNLTVSGVKYLKIELNPKTDLKNYYNQYSTILYNAVLTKE